MKNGALLWAALLLALLGCGNPENKALAPLSHATMTPGESFGDLKLGTTTLSEVVAKYGSGTLSVSYGDQTMIELQYLNGQLAFGFVLCGECQNVTAGEKLQVGQDLEPFFAKSPSCRDLPLSSVSVGLSGKEPPEAFFQGSTDKGVKLGVPISSAAPHGTESSPSPGFLAGESDPGSDAAVDAPGIRIYKALPSVRATDHELRSGAQLPPERLAEIRKAAEEAKNGPITRITIYKMPDEES